MQAASTENSASGFYIETSTCFHNTEARADLEATSDPRTDPPTGGDIHRGNHRGNPAVGFVFGIVGRERSLESSARDEIRGTHIEF